jgi:hypothetical protein
MKIAGSLIPAWVALLLNTAGMSVGQLPPAEQSEFKRGAELARRYCASCHLFADPSLQDKETWRNGTMPMMRKQLGIDRLDPADPAQKIVLEEWALIWKYYLAAAPDQALPPVPRARIGLVPPHDQRLGKLILLDKSTNTFTHRADVLADLPRPTDCAFGDLNGDGKDDLVGPSLLILKNNLHQPGPAPHRRLPE